YRTALSFYDSIREGAVYPGWNAEASGGYGDPSFRFYPPAAYYAFAAARALAGNWYDASLLLFALLSAAGALGVYFWARTFLPASLAVWAGILYTLAPYHINEIYQAFLLPEYAASAVLPFAFAFTTLVCTKGRARDVAGLSASYALLILTHLPLAVIGSFALLAYALLMIDKPDSLKTVIRLALAVAVGLAASARYWVMMAAELPWMKGSGGKTVLWFDYRYNFLFWKSVEGSTTWWANVLAIATALMFAPGVIMLLVRKEARGRTARAVALLALFSFFMGTPLSRLMWAALPPLQKVEFPWRWLAVTSMCAPVIVAWSIPHWVEKARTSKRPLAILAAGCVLMACAITMFQIIRGATYLPRPVFDSMAQDIARSNSIDYWLPLWAGARPKEMEGPVEVEGRRSSVNSWGPQRRDFEVSSGDAADARVRTYYYPHWVAKAGSKQLETRPDSDGALLVSLPPDAVSVSLEFIEPVRVRVATFASIIGWILIGATTTALNSKYQGLIRWRGRCLL
ncbi:MAG TPA: 6-pyruvoyl-tetrahydropterin synthase-related protein, partial [Blastocatellia bacterium]|nr:6-pyruvoyl-tetrahydropterin synthase-related protein [Blastocatellia bacterium]